MRSKILALGALKIKSKLLFLVGLTIRKLQAFQEWISRVNEVDINTYNSLSPIDSADIDNHYFNAISWALTNRRVKNIRNIALTGPFGSGKSSILKTFQKKYNKSDLKFLNLSLATFKEEKEKTDKTDKPLEREVLRLIELSILQQIFYHEEDSKIPDSRFKKIKSYSKLNLWLTAVGLLVFALALLNYLNPSIIQSFFKDLILGETVLDVLHYGTYIVIVLGFFLILLRSIRIISSITINKFKIQNTEIALDDKNTSKSILNNYLDEIVYFFEVTPYNVVIIEDLDRFKETEIFTKLREINLLLNSSEKTKRKEIVFIYAVRDDMFIDKDRTKFFDFIIPVIPVINPSTSGQILIDKNVKHKFNFSDDLIDSISLFIDDMRLLHNITNEFYLYKQLLDSHLSADKLLAMLVYKNIFPKDFTLLANGRGVLYSCLYHRNKFVSEEIQKIDDQIQKATIEIKELENVRLKDTKELRSLYILQAISSLSNFQSFIINEIPITIEELNSDEYFEYLLKNEIRYNQLFSNTYGLQVRQVKIPKSFEQIEKNIDGKSFFERKNELDSLASKKIETLKKQIQAHEARKIEVRSSRIKELLQSGREIEFKKVKDNHQNLIKVLLRNGFISEDYLDYISIFYEGSITRGDNQFVICVKSQKDLPPDYLLSKIDKLIQKLNVLDFKTRYVLNYALVDHILTSEKYELERSSLFKKLMDESKESIEFIDKYIERTPSLEKFVKVLSHSWSGFWRYIDTSSTYPIEKKTQYLKYILEYAETSDIQMMANDSDLLKTILNDASFLSIISNAEKLKSIIGDLKIQFTNLNFNSSPRELIEFVYQNDFYLLNKDILQAIIKYMGTFNQITFDNSNYSSIKKSGCEKLIHRVDSNINEYLEQVYFKIETNVNEEEGYLKLLLNNSTIESKNIFLIIQKTETKINDINDVNLITLRQYLLSESKVVPSWHNLFVCFTDSGNKITEEILAFLNNISNSEELSKVKIPKEINGENIYSEFWKRLLLTDEINDESYELITKSSPWWYSDLSIGEFQLVTYPLKKEHLL
jgi:hypothetical protein